MLIGLFSPSFSLLRCIARCFKISNITVRDMSRWSRHRVMPHTLTQHAIVLKFSGGQRCTDILKVTGFGHERGVKKNWFYGGSSLLVDVYTLGLTTFDAFQIPQCYYRTFNPLFGVNVVNQLFFIRFRSESQIIAGPNLYLCRPRRDRSFKRCSLVNAVIFMGVICSCSDDRNCGTEGSLVINHGSITFQHSG